MLQKGSLCCSCAQAGETWFHSLEGKSKQTYTAPLALRPFLLPTTGAGRIREGESFVAANSAAKKSISSDDFFNVPPRLPFKCLLAARLRVASEEDDDDDETKESDSDKDMAPTRSSLCLEIGDGQLQAQEH